MKIKCMLVIILIILVCMTSCVSKKNNKIDYIVFQEDNIKKVDVDNFTMHQISFDEYKNQDIKNILISDEFLTDNKKVDSIIKILDDGATILIETNLSCYDIYKLFTIDEKERGNNKGGGSYKSTSEELIPIGILIFKEKGMYYTVSQSIDKEIIEDKYWKSLISAFRFNKDNIVW